MLGQVTYVRCEAGQYLKHGFPGKDASGTKVSDRDLHILHSISWFHTMNNAKKEWPII